MSPKGKENILLRAVEAGDIKKLFTWRNHPEIRKNFFNTAPVVWGEHEKWFREKIGDPDAKIYMAFDKDLCIGMVRFENRGDVVQCSVIVNPNYIGQGFGTKIIAMGTRKYLAETQTSKVIIAEVKVNNINSLEAFQKAGFKAKYVTLAYSRKENCFIKNHDSLEGKE